MEGGFSKKEIEQFVLSNADLSKWINDCYKDRQAQSEEFDIMQKLYEIYAETFRSRGLRYHGENYDVLRNRARIATYIEF